MLKKSNGFTLIKVMSIMLFFIVIIAIGYIFVLQTVCRGNFWYTESGVLTELRIEHPNVTKVLKTTRNVFSKSIITVIENAETQDYCLDTSILWNYEFSDCQQVTQEPYSNN